MREGRKVPRYTTKYRPEIQAASFTGGGMIIVGLLPIQPVRNGPDFPAGQSSQ
jgi:hypothetical protein